MRHPIAHLGPWLAAAVVVLASFAAGWAASAEVPTTDEGEFDVFGWELRHVPDKWLYLTGRFLTGGLPVEEQDERIARYLLLTAQLRDLGTDGADEARRGRVRDEREEIENDVEAVIEGRLTTVLREIGLTSSLPLFPDAAWVFPPVDFELDQPPRVLNVSPRERIELVAQRQLDPGLPLSDVVELERELEAGGELSALAEASSGFSTYPSIIAPRTDYEVLVATVAHEWVHHYLVFRPLGLHYADSVELRTLNETVADLAGQEVAARYIERYPLLEEVEAQLGAPDQSPEEIAAELRALRLEVEALLDDGEVETAESLMEQRRLELAEEGVVFRRVNQAFFAFRDVYAFDPVSIDPIGGQVIALRARAGTLERFMREVSGVTSAEEVDGLLR